MPVFVYYSATSINGFIADAENSLGWLFAVPGAEAGIFSDFTAGVGVQVMGATTYEWLIDHEHLIEEPEKWVGLFGAMATRVFSSRDLELPAGVDIAILRGPVGDHVSALKAAAGDRDVWIVGGGDLAGQFLDIGCLHRIELAVAPVFLDGGAPLLPRFVPSDRLRLATAERVGPFARLVYDVVPSP